MNRRSAVVPEALAVSCVSFQSRPAQNLDKTPLVKAMIKTQEIIMGRTRTFAILLAVLLALGVTPTTAARADSPSPEVRAKIEAKLRSLGFTDWKEIEAERQGTEWAIDDARTADGQQFDVTLAADDLRELSREPD
jgi:hypothetical protein